MGEGVGRDRDREPAQGPPVSGAEPAPAPSSVGFLLSQLGVISSRGFAARLEPLGIDPPRFRLLMVISQQEGRSQQALGEALQVPPSRMVALVDELEDAGLIERRAVPDDRRVRALHLTPKGRRLFAKAWQCALEYEAMLCSDLADFEREELIGLLRRLVVSQGVPAGVHPGMGS